MGICKNPNSVGRLMTDKEWTDYMNKEFIGNNLSREEVCNNLEISLWYFMKRNSELGIKKSKDLSNLVRKRTCKEKYGSENVADVKSIKEKKIKTCQEKYGGNSPMSSKEIQEKIKRTCKEKYSVDYAFQLNQLNNEEHIKSLQEKYGKNITNVFQLEEVKEKIKNTNKKKYGVENPMQNELIKNKSIKNSIKKNLYNVKHSSIEDEIVNYLFI